MLFRSNDTATTEIYTLSLHDALPILVNGAALGDQPHQLNDHDVIELAGVKMEFYFKE